MDKNRNSPLLTIKEDDDGFACHRITAPLTQLCNYTWVFMKHTPCASSCQCDFRSFHVRHSCVIFYVQAERMQIVSSCKVCYHEHIKPRWQAAKSLSPNISRTQTVRSFGLTGDVCGRLNNFKGNWSKFTVVKCLSLPEGWFWDINSSISIVCHFGSLLHTVVKQQ